ncbi:MAG TPA: DUF2950 family protein [Candidatus Acidoferrales bacterium]|nr:DUF2950 family protein [Candidatus Acidoferrales bacterium]
MRWREVRAGAVWNPGHGNEPWRDRLRPIGASLPLRWILLALLASAAALAQTAPNAERRAASLSAPLRAPYRRASANEPAVIEACYRYVRAQLEYFSADHAGDGYLSFAGRIRSTPGKHDGLYWPVEGGDDESPIGPNFAAAAWDEIAPEGRARPYFGYYFKVLLSQGPDAAGGARDYSVGGRLIAGFALIAWPAEYGVTGTMTFQVNQLGVVYGKDLGSNTPSAAGITVFSPDATWSKFFEDNETTAK